MSRKGRQRARFSFGDTRITRGALYLLFAEVGMSLIYLLSASEGRLRIAEWLTASSDQVWQELKLWTLVTSPLLQIEFIWLIFDAFILWLFLPALERLWGTKKFLLFALWTSLAGTVGGTLFGLVIGDPAPVAGLNPFVYAGIVAYGVLYGDRPVSFFGILPMTGKQLMIGILVVLSLFVILDQQWVAGAAFGAAMLLSWLLTSGKWRPRLWFLRWKHKRLRRHLRVVRDDDDRDTWLN